MLGYSHALSGVAAGMALTLATPGAPWPVDALAVALVGGGSLLPDLDHPSSTAARSLGPITRLLARGLDRLSLTVYHATRLPADPAERRSGHRLVTHTPVGALGFGVVAAVSTAVSPVSAGVSIGLVVGLLALGLRRRAGLGVAVVSGVAGYLVSVEYPGWWWLYGVAVAVGCHVHREGDWCTTAGVPRRLWPRVSNGRRWDLHRCPRPFDTGGAEEVYVVRKVLWVAVVVSTVAAVGALPAVVSTVWTVAVGGVR